MLPFEHTSRGTTEKGFSSQPKALYHMARQRGLGVLLSRQVCLVAVVSTLSHPDPLCVSLCLAPLSYDRKRRRPRATLVWILRSSSFQFLLGRLKTLTPRITNGEEPTAFNSC